MTAIQLSQPPLPDCSLPVHLARASVGRCIVCERIRPAYLRLCPIETYDRDAKLPGEIMRLSHLHSRFSSPVFAPFGLGGFEVVGTQLRIDRA